MKSYTVQMRTPWLRPKKAQHGSALLIILAIVMAALMAVLVSALPKLDRTAANANANAQVLAQAKAGLIAYAITVGSQQNCGGGTNCERPGDLPCPDATPDTPVQANGNAAGSCGAGTGITSQATRLGRLPWKTLNLPDLRDASGQRLWYAVSNNYKNNTRIPILNSETGLGTITIRNASGSVSFNGSNPGNIPSGVVAVIIAPGAPITRQDGHTQDRSVNAAQEYLDIVTINGITEDNADFIDQSATNGFIQGPIQNAQGNIISNDQMVFITYDEIMSALEKRVAGDVMQTIASMQYPNPASFSDASCLGTTALTNPACPASGNPACTPNSSTPTRTLIINCSTSPTQSPCTADAALVTNKSLIEVTCPAGVAASAALAFRCSPSISANNGGCGAILNAGIAANACNSPGTFNVEICSGRTTLAQTPPSNCGRVPPGIGLQSWGSTDLTRGATTNYNSWFQRNGWRELVFYALPGNCTSQTGTPFSGQLSITPTPNSKPANAIVVVAGRPLNGQQRSNSTYQTDRNNYLEAGNGNSMAFTIQQRSATFNDTVIGQ